MNTEIEVKFLEIPVQETIKKLLALGAKDLGEDLLREVIFYDTALTWVTEREKQSRVVRIRENKNGIFLAYKNHKPGILEAEEIELNISDSKKMSDFLYALGYPPYRTQEQKRRSFRLGDVLIDFNTWPKIPTFMEIEGPSIEALQDTAKYLGLDWTMHSFENSGKIIENIYNIPLGTMKWFTFERQG